MKILLLSTKKYDFTNADGTQVKGTKISYLLDSKSCTETLEGYAPLEMSIQDTNGIKDVAGIYEVDCSFAPGKNNKATAMFTNFKLIKPIEIEKLF